MADYYYRKRTDVFGSVRSFELSRFHFNILDNKANVNRMSTLMERKEICKNIFIHDDQLGRIVYYGRNLTDDEKFREKVWDLF